MKTLTKIVSVVLLAVMLFAVLGVSVFAVRANRVTYVGESNKFVFDSRDKENPTDLFGGLKDVMPGDKVRDTIIIDNDISEDIKISLFIRATGADEASQKFLSQLGLTVSDAKENVMYQGTADRADGLEDWFKLGTIYSGGKVELNLDLEVPLTLGNEFQNAVGKIGWEFKVEELPVEKDDPKTGDNSNVWLWIVIAAVSLAGAATLIAVTKKKKSN